MRQNPSANRQSGLTLVEMMVAVAIGLVVTGAITAVFLQSRVSASQDDNLARMQENARFALNLLRSELIHADFMAELVDGGATIVVPDPVELPDTDCSNSAGEKWLYQLANPNKRLFHMDNVADGATANLAYDCIGGDFKPNTDILAVQRLLAAPTEVDDLPVDDKAVYVRASMSEAKMFHNDGAAAPTVPNARDWRYLARIYYVNNDDELVRESLTAGVTPAMTREVLIDGIDRFHIDFGIDSNGDGIADYYQPAPSPEQILKLVTARIFVLARSPKVEKEIKLQDKQYQLGSELVDAFGDQYYRRVYTTTVMVRNFTYRLGLGQR